MKFDDLEDWGERAVVAKDGEVVGRVGAVHVAKDSGEVHFVQVSTSLEGEQPVVPVLDETTRSGALVLPYSQRDIKRGPRMPVDRPLSNDEVTSVRDHYDDKRGSRGPIVVIKPGASKP